MPGAVQYCSSGRGHPSRPYPGKYGGVLSQIDILFTIGLGVAYLGLIGLAVALVAQRRRHRELEVRYRRLLEGTNEKGMGDVLLKHVDRIHENAEQIQQLQLEYERLLSESAGAVRHIGLVRYNPFDDMGGDYSVALALADDQGRGLVMSSLHGRTATRLYVRSLNDWVSSSPLSAEEQEAVRIAQQDHNK